MSKLYLWLLMSLFLFAETLEVGLEESYKTKAYIKYSLAQNNSETPKDMTNRNWTRDKNTFNTFENRDSAYWAKLELKNSTLERKKYYLKSENQFTYHIKFFLVKDGKVVDTIEDGVIFKNKEREFNVNHMIFPLTLAPHEEAKVFFKIQNYNKIDIDFTLVTKEYLIDYYQSYDVVEGIFLGGMLILIFYNLFLYFLLKFRAYIYYVFYTFWLTVYFIGLFGFSQRYFPEYTWIFHISAGALFLFMTFFIQSILNLKEQLPKINMVLNIFIVYFVIATITNIFMLEFHLFSYAQMLFNLFFIIVPIYAIIIIFVTYYLAFFKKDPVAKIYSFVWTMISIIGALVPLVYLNILKTDVPSDYIFQFLMLFEVLCFTFVLAYKIKTIQNEQQTILIEQSKLASMGEMISSIAHQWRQPLSEINGVVLNMDVDYRKDKLTNDRLDKHLNDIEGITSYLSKTIHDFMNLFSHNKELEEFSLIDAIISSRRLAMMFVKDKFTLTYSKDINIVLLGYQSELIQALLIVIHNSIDAARQNGVESAISVEVKEIKNNVYINIEDNGGGISEEILKNIFNPYFTTKHESQGTGLGLYILKMIIEESMSGSVQIFNKNKGVNCKIVIPKNLGNRKSKRDI